MTKKKFGKFLMGEIFEKLTVKKAPKAELRKSPSKEYSIPANSGSSDHAFRYELIRFSGCN